MIVEAEAGIFAIPDFDEAAPAWAKKRAARAEGRKAAGKTISDLRSEAGLKGAAARASKRETSGRRLNPTRQQTAPLPSFLPSLLPSSPSVESEALTLVAEAEPAPKKRAAADDGFEDFWSHYPKLRREEKGAARAAWKKLSETERTAALAAVVEFGRSWEGATEEQVKFVPFPAKWLKTERWKTEPAVWHAAAAARRAEGRPRGIAAQRLIQHDDPTPEGVLEVRASDDPEGETPVDAAPDPIHADPDLARLLELYPRPGDTESALAAWRSLSAESRAAAVKSVETIRRVANVANPGERERILPAGRWLATGAWRRDLEDTAADVLGHRAAALLPQLACAWGTEARP